MRRLVAGVLLGAAGLLVACGGDSAAEIAAAERRAQAAAARQAAARRLRSLGPSPPGVRVAASSNTTTLPDGWTEASLGYRRSADTQLAQAVAVIGERDDLLAMGRELFVSQSCVVCHAVEAGVSSEGPNFAARGGAWGSLRAVSGDRPVVLNLDYVNESLMTPTRRVARGFSASMPSYRGVLEPRDVVALGVYLESLARPVPTEAEMIAAAPTTEPAGTPAEPATVADAGEASPDLSPVLSPPPSAPTTAGEPSGPIEDPAADPAPAGEPTRPVADPAPPVEPDPAVPDTSAADAAVLRANRPAWYFEGLRVDGGVATACVEVLDLTIAATRAESVRAARDRIADLLGLDSPAALESDRLELVSVIPVASDDGSVRYAGYVLISADR